MKKGSFSVRLLNKNVCFDKDDLGGLLSKLYYENTSDFDNRISYKFGETGARQPINILNPSIMWNSIDSAKDA